MATDTDPSAGDDYNAERIIAAFGGIRPMAKKLGLAVTTVQGWKDRGAIPLARMTEIRAAAQQAGIDLNAAPPPQHVEEPEPVQPEQVQPEKIEPTPPHGVKEAPSAPKDATIAPPRPRAWYFRPAFIAGVLGIAAGGIAVYYLIGALRAPGADPAVAAQLANAEQRIAQLETQIKSAGTGAEQLAQLRQSLSQLTARIDSLPRQPAAAETAKLAADLKSLGDQVAALDRRLTAAPPADSGAAQAALRDALAKIAQLERRVSELAARPATMTTTPAPNAAALDQLRTENETLRGELKTLAERLANVEKQKAAPTVDPNLGSSAFIVAVGQLRDAIASGKPFIAAFDSVRALAGNDAALSSLLAQVEPHAAKGVATVEQLRARFQPLPVKILRAARMPEEGDWVDRAWARMKSVVIVRRTGENVTGDSIEAAVARAEARLKAGDVAGAVAALDAIKGPGAEPAAEWLAQAKTHVGAAEAADKLSQAAVAALARQAAPKEPAK
ncbi:MAG: mitofilin family membrane protein [Alphaproteobacteria bacterium]